MFIKETENYNELYYDESDLMDGIIPVEFQYLPDCDSIYHVLFQSRNWTREYTFFYKSQTSIGQDVLDKL